MKADLRAAVRRLRKLYGPPAPPPSKDPFELVLWENVAYLAPPARRREAFGLLKRTIGTKPEQVLHARPMLVKRVTAHGILKDQFASKLAKCAVIAVTEFDGNVKAWLRGSVEESKRALRKFPGIGEPGAEKILLFSGLQPFLAPDSNALRVLTRLGLVQEQKSYARTYAASRAAADTLPATIRARQEAHLLLQQHGRTLCKSTAPRCDDCPLADVCQFAAQY